jgi:hypothetical protein
MTPENEKALTEHISAIAKILYEDTPSEELTTLESIETTVRDKITTYVSPHIVFFYQTSHRNGLRKKKNLKKLPGTTDNYQGTSRHLEG